MEYRFTWLFVTEHYGIVTCECERVCDADAFARELLTSVGTKSIYFWVPGNIAIAIKVFT